MQPIVEVWYKELGFYNNPFSIKPAAYHPDLFGYEETVQDILHKVQEGTVLLITGAYGTGKTSILKRIIREFGGKKQLVYYSCNRSEYDLDVQRLLKKRYGFLGNLLGLKAKNMVLLLDEAQELNKYDCEELLDHFQNGDFKSIVLVSKDYTGLDLEKGLKDVLGENTVHLAELGEDNAVKLIRKRIGNLALLSDETIRKVYERSGKNPRQMLKTCEELCKYALENGEEKVTEEHLRRVLSPSS